MVIVSTIHHPIFLLIIILLLFVISHRDILKISKKVILSTIFFTGSVSGLYLIYGLLQHNLNLNYLIFINLRVFTLTYLSFFTFSKINLFKALSFSKDLSYVLILSYSQILNYKKLFEEWKLFMRSRVVKKISFKDYLIIYGYLTSLLAEKSFKNAKEVSSAMKSRGFFND
jgi:cobalt/nickel transport system permease protein